MIYEKSVSLIGYGKSNRAMHEYLLKNGIVPTVRNASDIAVPVGTRLITEDYLNVSEELAVRSPVIRPDRIRGDCRITSEIACALEIMKGKKIGVTGSDGKTTVSTLIYSMLKADKKEAALCGNIGVPAIDTAQQSTHDTHTVLELSSFQLMDIAPQLDTAVITNVTENHLDWHTDMDEYIGAKRNVLKNARRCVLNYGDKTVRELYMPDKETVFFSLDAPDKTHKNAHYVFTDNGWICYDGKRVVALCDIALSGAFNVLNIEAALGALFGEVSTDAIESVATSFTGVSGRMELVKTLGGVSFYDSSIDSTPSRTISTLSAFYKAKTVLILGGYDKNLSYDCLSGALCGIKGAVLCGANRDKIYASVRGVCDIYVTDTLEDAVKQAFDIASDGDSVLLSPASASFDAFENYKERSEKFKEIIRKIQKEG